MRAASFLGMPKIAGPTSMQDRGGVKLGALYRTTTEYNRVVPCLYFNPGPVIPHP